MSSNPSQVAGRVKTSRTLGTGLTRIAVLASLVATLAVMFTSPATAAVPAGVAPSVVTPRPSALVLARMRASKVFVVGDSLTVGSEPYIQAGLRGAVRSVAINARVGRFTSEGISLLSPQSPSRVWVVALGTNDGTSRAATRAWIARVMALAGKRQVIILTIVRPGGYGGVNDEIITARLRYRNLQVVNWVNQLARYPWYLGRDGVHLTNDGYRFRGQVIASAVKYSAGKP